jgi:hypothetical protein
MIPAASGVGRNAGLWVIARFRIPVPRPRPGLERVYYPKEVFFDQTRNQSPRDPPFELALSAKCRRAAVVVELFEYPVHFQLSKRRIAAAYINLERSIEPGFGDESPFRGPDGDELLDDDKIVVASHYP